MKEGRSIRPTKFLQTCHYYEEGGYTELRTIMKGGRRS